MENKYFHKKIVVTDNRFLMINDSVALFNNAEEIVFKGNTVEYNETVEPILPYSTWQRKRSKPFFPSTADQ